MKRPTKQETKRNTALWKELFMQAAEHGLKPVLRLLVESHRVDPQETIAEKPLTLGQEALVQATMHQHPGTVEYLLGQGHYSDRALSEVHSDTMPRIVRSFIHCEKANLHANNDALFIKLILSGEYNLVMELLSVDKKAAAWDSGAMRATYSYLGIVHDDQSPSEMAEARRQIGQIVSIQETKANKNVGPFMAAKKAPHFHL